MIRNQQNLYPKFPPTAVVKLLQYSGLGSNTGMGFLRTNDLSEVKNGELNLDFKGWVKTWEIGCSLIETKIKKMSTRTP